jgi:poly-gamma-glutamate synthesis protein (capsule biosynthesis protein)
VIKRQTTQIIIFLAVFLLLFAACDPLQQPSQTTPTTIESTLPPTTTPGANHPAATPTEHALTIWFDPALPSDLLEGEIRTFYDQYGSSEESATFKLTFNPEQELSRWVFALVAPFTTVQDSVSHEEFQNFWQNGSDLSVTELVMEQSTLEMLTAIYGTPHGQISALTPGEMLGYRITRTNAWAVVPFQQIQPTWKVIAIDGVSPLRKDFDPSGYPLSFGFGLSVAAETQADKATVDAMASKLQAILPETNRDEEKLTTVILTGVTALTRATAKEMELYGVLSPAESVGEVMREADITHVSNEVPFASNCPAPQWVQSDLRFCSDVRYIDLMREIGTDVVELTGDHFADWGPEPMYLTLEMYRDEGWSYYGGGWDLNEARQPLKIEHNGNKIAFLGCNAKAPGYATASETVPGALHCDMEDMAAKVKALDEEGYLVIVTFQHQEIYRWHPTEQMIADSRRMVEAGADVVSGSQAHVPHIYEFYQDGFIHYGLGNLFFDQLGWFDNSNKAFLDRHVFYDGKYIGVELLTAQFFNWSTPTLMTPEARGELLNELFENSSQFQ